MGFLWNYYACMEGAVYDVTDWAACQAGNLKHLRANTHSVQYRIVLGQRLPSQTSSSGKKRQQIDPNTRYILFDFIDYYVIIVSCHSLQKLARALTHTSIDCNLIHLNPSP